MDPFTYGSAIWFEHIAQLHGDDIVRAIFEAVDDAGGSAGGADWFALLDDVLANAAVAPSGFDEDFVSFATGTIDVVTPESIALPYSTASFLTFIASWHTLSFNPSGRPQVRVVLVGEGIDADGIHLVVAPDGETPEVIAPTAAPGDEDTPPIAFDVTRQSTERFFRVQIINTRRDGNGSRPRLCIGNDVEVDECIAEEIAPPAEGEGEGEGEAEGEPPSCACASAVHTPARSSSAASLLPVLTMLYVWRRRRGPA